jgi:hypothetical protein
LRFVCIYTASQSVTTLTPTNPQCRQSVGQWHTFYLWPFAVIAERDLASTSLKTGSKMDVNARRTHIPAKYVMQLLFIHHHNRSTAHTRDTSGLRLSSIPHMQVTLASDLEVLCNARHVGMKAQICKPGKALEVTICSPFCRCGE